MTDPRPRTRPGAPRDDAPEREATMPQPRAAQPAPPRPIPPLPPRPGSVAGVRPATIQAAHTAYTGRDDTPPSGTVSPSGSSQEARHRGWYWHWNTLITQYAPLIGLKGVGLLNSYTVWTDRREGSPHQGFAFPAQESEARFYGEGREELITLNKILVALDLIEIHKEMVVRQDERGRRWRVPHNFYRVKDPKDGLVLGLPAMLRLLELARRDRNVFRQIRHIFGPQFTAIDRTNLWHSLLPELRALPLWADLEARAARERRTPRKTATAANGESHATSVVTSELDSGIVPLTSEDLDYNGHATTTPLGETGTQTADKGRDARDTAAPGNGAPRDHPAVFAAATRADGDTASASTAASPFDAAAQDDNEGSLYTEGMMGIEDALHSSVRPNDRMHYQPGETKEEATDTTSTTSRARVREDEDRPDTETGRMLRASRPMPPPTPPRPAVSDLFTALAEQRGAASPDPEYPAPDTVLWDAADITPPTDDAERAALAHEPAPFSASENAADRANDALTQPLPPEPGEGAIVVRDVEVTNGRAVGADDRALIADIEAALTMTNGRPPSDMEMSLYWQIARDCDTAARSQPGPGTGFGWVLAAITEAVNSSGTGRLAPKYVARICERWATDGYMRDGRVTPAPDVPPPPPQWPLTPAPDAAVPDIVAPDPGAVAASPAAPAVLTPSVPVIGPPPSEADVARMWASVRRRLEGVLPAAALGQRWFTGSRVVAVEGTSVRVEAPDAESARTLANYRGLISRRLSDVLGYSAEAVFETAPQPPDPPVSEPPAPDVSPPDSSPPDPASPAVIPTAGTAGDAPAASLVPDEAAPLTAISAISTAPTPAAPRNRPAGGRTGQVSTGQVSTGSALPAVATDMDEGAEAAEAAPRARTGSGPMRLIALLPRREASAGALAPTPPAAPAAPAPVALTLVPSVPTFVVGSEGETNTAIWARALAHLQQRMSAAPFQVWIEPTALIARDADGIYVIGARNRVQRERLERQHTADIAAALSAVLGHDVRVRIAVIGTPDAVGGND